MRAASACRQEAIYSANGEAMPIKAAEFLSVFQRNTWESSAKHHEGTQSSASASKGFTMMSTRKTRILRLRLMIAERAENLPRYPKLGSILSSGEEEEHARKEHSSAIMTMTLPVLLLFANLYTSKNPAFREEQEWRLIAFIPTGGPNGEMLTDCDFRASGDRIVPFVSVSMLDHGVRPIDRIILGPKKPDPTKDSASAFGWTRLFGSNSRAVNRLVSLNCVSANSSPGNSSRIARA